MSLPGELALGLVTATGGGDLATLATIQDSISKQQFYGL